MAPFPEGLNQQWQAIRRHPDFSFGIIFAKESWPFQRQPEGVDIEGIEQHLQDAGYAQIDQHAERDRGCDQT